MMNEQVMIYEVKSAAAANAVELFSNDSNFFYWNETKFKNLNIGDFVFVVNRTNKWVLFSKLDKVDINTTEKDNNTIFNDNSKTFNVSGKYDKFIRLQILNKLLIPEGWEWTTLGSSETTYLNGSRIGLQSSENRVKNINQLLDLTDETEEILETILKNCLVNFTGVGSQKTITKNNQLTKSNQDDYMISIINAIKTKPFILLAGISGTGKSRLVRTLAYKTCTKKELQSNDKPGNFELIPVRPNWHDSTDLIGFVSRINGEKYIITPFLRFIAKAWKHQDVPFFLCLDEMNLAPVEQYFAEYLSIIETRKLQGEILTTDKIISKSNFENIDVFNKILEELDLVGDVRFEDGISIPHNLVVVGTVNMDETTHSFSRKVLDRAMTFEMNNVDLDLGLLNTSSDWSYPSEFIEFEDIIGNFSEGSHVYNLPDFSEKEQVLIFLKEINEILEGSSFKIAYRVRDEFLIYCYYSSILKSNDKWLFNAIDDVCVMKILSRIEGDENRTSILLELLLSKLNEDYPKSNAKLLEMQKRLISGYTSYWS
jgi:5-methylcytosine-specific restriction protein B